MTITIYVNWNTEELVSEKEKAEKIEEISNSLKTAEEEIERFLTYVNDFSIADIFVMTDANERADLLEAFYGYCLERATDLFENEYDKMEIEI